MALGRILGHGQRFILTRLFGLDGDEEETLTATATFMGLSKERVRQRKLEALEKLRVKSVILDDDFEASLSTEVAPPVKPPWTGLDRVDGADWYLGALTRFVDADPRFWGAWKCLLEEAIRTSQAQLTESVLARLPSDIDDRKLCSINSTLVVHFGPRRVFELYKARARKDWWIFSMLIRGGGTRWVLDCYEKMGTWSAMDAYLVALARLRLREPYGTALIFALELDQNQRHHPIQGQSVFFEWTRDLWRDPPGALTAVARWTEAPLVKRWLKNLWSYESSMTQWTWAKRSEVAREVETTLGADRGSDELKDKRAREPQAEDDPG